MFKIISSPHSHASNFTPNVMFWVILAMLPAWGINWYFFGWGVMIQTVLAICLAIVIEIAIAKMRRHAATYYLSDLSGILTACILALAIPPYAPYWIIIVGTLVSLVLAKHVYGGLGQNLFNPAMVGYALLLVSFPLQMTTWLPPLKLLAEAPTFHDSLSLIFHQISSDGLTIYQLINSIDGITQATPLDSAKTNLTLSNLTQLFHSPIFVGEFAIGWWQMNVAFLTGGLFLIYKKIIHWHIPVSILISFSLFSGMTNLFYPDTHLGLFSQLLSGAMMFGAFFIATDPVTASITPKGKLIFGMLIGMLLYLIRYYGNYPDGVAFAVLIANIFVPLIDHYTQPRLYGEK